MANDWLQYDLAGKTRDEPISPELMAVLEAAARVAGVDVRIASGGQPSTGSNRVGSHRHDQGNAADLQITKDGRALDFTNPVDRAVFQTFVSAAARNGATGIGAGTDYMGPSTIHVGFGAPAVWGAGGRSRNAPEWLSDAYTAGRNGTVIALPAMTPPAALAAAPVPQPRPANVQMVRTQPVAPANLPSPSQIAGAAGQRLMENAQRNVDNLNFFQKLGALQNLGGLKGWQATGQNLGNVIGAVGGAIGKAGEPLNNVAMAFAPQAAPAAAPPTMMAYAAEPRGLDRTAPGMAAAQMANATPAAYRAGVLNSGVLSPVNAVQGLPAPGVAPGNAASRSVPTQALTSVAGPSMGAYPHMSPSMPSAAGPGPLAYSAPAAVGPSAAPMAGTAMRAASPNRFDGAFGTANRFDGAFGAPLPTVSGASMGRFNNTFGAVPNVGGLSPIAAAAVTGAPVAPLMAAPAPAMPAPIARPAVTIAPQVQRSAPAQSRPTASASMPNYATNALSIGARLTGMTPSLAGIGSRAIDFVRSGAAPPGSVATVNPGNLPEGIKDFAVAAGPNGFSTMSYEINGKRVDSVMDAAGNSYGGSAGTGSKVICTYFRRKGWLSQELWKADFRYSANHVSPVVLRGYRWWATPLVRRMQAGDGRLERILWPLTLAWTKERARLQGEPVDRAPRDIILARTLKPLFMALFWITGHVASERDWRALWTER